LAISRPVEHPFRQLGLQGFLEDLIDQGEVAKLPTTLIKRKVLERKAGWLKKRKQGGRPKD